MHRFKVFCCSTTTTFSIVPHNRHHDRSLSIDITSYWGYIYFMEDHFAKMCLFNVSHVVNKKKELGGRGGLPPSRVHINYNDCCCYAIIVAFIGTFSKEMQLHWNLTMGTLRSG